MHLASGDRQMNTEMHYTRKFELVGSNAILCVSERDMLWSISKNGYFQTGTESNLPYSPGYTESQVIEVIATFAWLMFQVIRIQNVHHWICPVT